MEDGGYDAFVSIIEKRKLNSANPVVDGFGNFLYLDKNNNPSPSYFCAWIPATTGKTAALLKTTRGSWESRSSFLRPTFLTRSTT